MESPKQPIISQDTPIKTGSHQRRERLVITVTQLRGPRINLFKSCTTSRQQTQETNCQELLQRMQTLRAKLVVLRQQCEGIRATINTKPPNISAPACITCGKSIKGSGAATFNVGAEQKLICKKCFTELLK